MYWKQAHIFFKKNFTDVHTVGPRHNAPHLKVVRLDSQLELFDVIVGKLPHTQNLVLNDILAKISLRSAQKSYIFIIR